jgi:transposase InsO family protein
MHQQGMAYPEIARQTGIGYYTVRRWCRAQRDGGWDALIPKQAHRPAKGKLSSFDPLIRYVALRLKRERPNWGPDLILLKLSQRPSLTGKTLPSRSALADYLKPYLSRVKKTHRRTVLQRPAFPQIKVTQPHEGWQMDFKGRESLGTCGDTAPLQVVDMLTSAWLHSVLYPGYRKGVTWRNVQHELRQVFAQWGLPDFIKMDRDSVFVGSTRLEWPSGLMLWLVGLGVDPIVNRPHRPTDNAQVERLHGTWLNHVVVGADFVTYEEGQRATDQARYERLYLLPSRNPICQGQSPMRACPELAIPRRAYHPDQEAALFDFERVELYLSDWRFSRMVDKTGCISIADHNIHISRQWYRQAVEVIYDLDAHQFAAYTCDDKRALLCHFSHPVVTPEYLMQLEGATVCGGG